MPRLYNKDYAARLGIIVDEHGKLPDVIVHLETKNSLFLIEAVTSHGSIDIKRHNELKGLFRNVSLNLIFVTVFPSRKVMMKWL
jgi:adenine-specific DNA-methyltransferase